MSEFNGEPMFNEYRPTLGYDEYFCQKESAPRADLEPLKKTTFELGPIVEMNEPWQGIEGQDSFSPI